VSGVLPDGTKLHQGGLLVGKILGQGGFGITYHGADVKLRRYVAIKEFFPLGCVRNGAQVVPNNCANYSKAKARFFEEARILARFNHRNIVNVLTVFEENNTAYMVMEYLQGKTLQQLVEERGTLTAGEGISYVEQIGEALERVHETGLIHRDIKPDNISFAMISGSS
jgi:serine/threonine-protein kinase